MPGVLNVPPPIFLDANGAIMELENPVIGAPQGEVIQGEAMDINEEKGAKDKELDDNEKPQA